jgi:hypothetical protein
MDHVGGVDVILEDTCNAGVDLKKNFVGRFGVRRIFGRDVPSVYIAITVGRAGRRRCSLAVSLFSLPHEWTNCKFEKKATTADPNFRFRNPHVRLDIHTFRRLYLVIDLLSTINWSNDCSARQNASNGGSIINAAEDLQTRSP